MMAISNAELRERLLFSLPEDARRRTAKLAQLNDRYLPDKEHDQALKAGIATIFEQAAKKPTRGFVEGKIVLVTGESGAGKSKAIRNALAQQKAAMGGDLDHLFVECLAPSPCTSGQLAMAVLDGVSYQLVRELRENVAWRRARDQLKRIKPLAVWIDELQHILDHLQSEAEAVKFLNTVKTHVLMPQWPPVSLVLSGLPVLKQLAAKDRQIQRRVHEVILHPLSFPKDADRVRRNVVGIIKNDVGLKIDAAVVSDEFIARLIHTAAGALGLSIKLVDEAAATAFGNGRDTVTLRDFADAYARETGRPASENPFLVDNWHLVRPWYADAVALAKIQAAAPQEKAA